MYWSTDISQFNLSPVCVECGCIGNQKDENGKPCGHTSPDGCGCELNSAGVCPCCVKRGET